MKYLVDAPGGIITATSPGKGLGATFAVRLPLLRKAVVSTTASRLSADVNLAGLKILAVDDDADAREVLAAILAQYGADVEVVTSGQEALASLQRVQPALLICDIGRPGEDGYMLLQQLRALPPEQGGNIPAIALTAFAREEDRQQALQQGFAKHVAKPIIPEQLAVTVAALVQPVKIA